jgi:hypothetical protein
MKLRKRERIKETIKLMTENSCNKYFDLVWYARKDENKLLEEERYEILALIKKIEEKYPIEIKELNDYNLSDWSHGFNSGMLAASRLYLYMIEEDIEQAIEEFPFLDT